MKNTALLITLLLGSICNPIYGAVTYSGAANPGIIYSGGNGSGGSGGGQATNVMSSLLVNTTQFNTNGGTLNGNSGGLWTNLVIRSQTNLGTIVSYPTNLTRNATDRLSAVLNSHVLTTENNAFANAVFGANIGKLSGDSEQFVVIEKIDNNNVRVANPIEAGMVNATNEWYIDIPEYSTYDNTIGGAKTVMAIDSSGSIIFKDMSVSYGLRFISESQPTNGYQMNILANGDFVLWDKQTIFSGYPIIVHPGIAHYGALEIFGNGFITGAFGFTNIPAAYFAVASNGTVVSFYGKDSTGKMVETASPSGGTGPYINNLSGTGTNTTFKYATGTTNYPWQVVSSNGTFLAGVNTNGNLGIGTANPAANLDVPGTATIGTLIATNIPNKVLGLVGDSLTFQDLTNNASITNFPYLQSYFITNCSTVGWVVLLASNNYAQGVRPLKPNRQNDDKVVSFYAGFNNLFTGDSAVTTLGYLTNTWSAITNDGFKLIAWTIPSGVHLAATAGAETQRQILNGWIRSNYFKWTPMLMEPDRIFPATNDLTYFTDGTHHTYAGAFKVVEHLNYVALNRGRVPSLWFETNYFGAYLSFPQMGPLRMGVNNTTGLVFGVDGDIGVGGFNPSPTVPGSKTLQVKGTADVEIDLDPGASSITTINFRRAAADKWYLQSRNSPDVLSIYDAVNSAYRIVLDRSGLFGIGTTPSNKLDIANPSMTLRTNGALGYVLTSDANGTGTWQPAPFGSTGITNTIIITTNVDIANTLAETASYLVVTDSRIRTNRCILTVSWPWQEMLGGVGSYGHPFCTTSNGGFVIQFINPQSTGAIDPPAVDITAKIELY